MGEVIWAWLSIGVWLYALMAASGRVTINGNGFAFLAFFIVMWPMCVYLAVSACFDEMRCTCLESADGLIVFDTNCPKHKPKQIEYRNGKT